MNSLCSIEVVVTKLAGTNWVFHPPKSRRKRIRKKAMESKYKAKNYRRWWKLEYKRACFRELSGRWVVDPYTFEQIKRLSALSLLPT